MSIEIAASKPDAGYEYEGPIEHMPRNISPAVIIAGLPGAPVNNITFTNIECKHPGGGNPQFAKVNLDALDSVPEKPAAYPEFSMFGELPAWGIYVRHAMNIQFAKINFVCAKKDYRTAIVLDDVQSSQFTTTVITEPEKKKTIHQHKTSNIIVK